VNIELDARIELSMEDITAADIAPSPIKNLTLIHHIKAICIKFSK